MAEVTETVRYPKCLSAQPKKTPGYPGRQKMQAPEEEAVRLGSACEQQVNCQYNLELAGKRVSARDCLHQVGL